MKTLLLSMLIAITAGTASARRRPPETAETKADKQLVIEIDHVVDPGVDMNSSKIELYASGRWAAQVATKDRKRGPLLAGHIDKAIVQKLAADLAAVPWKITHNKIHCMAVSGNSTVYVTPDHSYTAKMCSSEVIDVKTQTVLQDADKLLGKLIAN